MSEKVYLNVKVALCEGVSKKGYNYSMIKIETGHKELDSSLKPIFLSSLQIAVLKNLIGKGVK